MNPDMRSLISRLNPRTRSAVENAAGLCVGRTHYDVEVEHFLRKLLDDNDISAGTDLASRRTWTKVWTG
jgi:type VI secretion system protein VasG